jgi:hypothetical protein
MLGKRWLGCHHWHLRFTGLTLAGHASSLLLGPLDQVVCSGSWGGNSLSLGHATSLDIVVLA